MMRMMQVKRDVKMNQAICRLGNNKTFFQSELPTRLKQGFSLIYTKVSIQCPFLFIWLLVIVVTTVLAILAFSDLIHMFLYEQTNKFVSCNTVFSWIHNW
jgi:hypothetical protein